MSQPNQTNQSYQPDNNDKITLGTLIEELLRIENAIPKSGAPLIKLIQRANTELGLDVNFITEDDQKKLKAFVIGNLDVNNPSYQPINLSEIKSLKNEFKILDAALMGDPTDPNNNALMVQFGLAQNAIADLEKKVMTTVERSKLAVMGNELVTVNGTNPDGTQKFELDHSKFAVRDFDGDVIVNNGDITAQKNSNGLYGSIRAQNGIGVGVNQNGNSAIQFNWNTNVTYSGQGIFFNNIKKEFQLDVDDQNKNFTLWHSGNFTPSANGDTTARPQSPEIGQMFFDTTLGKPIWAKSTTEWVTADGITA